MRQGIRRGISAFIALLILFGSVGTVCASGEADAQLIEHTISESAPSVAPSEPPTPASVETETPSPAPTVTPVQVVTASPTQASSESPSFDPTVTPIPSESTSPETNAPPVSPSQSVEPSPSISPELLGEATEVPVLSPLPSPEAPDIGLIRLPVGSVLYSDADCTIALGTLAEEGVAYASTIEEGGVPIVSFTPDGVSLVQGHLPANALVPLSAEEAAAYAAREGGLPCGDVLLFPLVFVAKSTYEQDTYGFPGMPDGYVLSDAELAKKKELRESPLLMQLSTLISGEGYAANEVLLETDSREYAEMVARSYGARVSSFEYGLAVLTLDGVDAALAVQAAADEDARLVAVYLNAYYFFEDPPTDGGKTSSDISLFSSVPALQTWRDYQDGDPFLGDIYSGEHHRLYRPITGGYQYMHDLVGTYGAWALSMGEGATVAVIDSGADISHEELSGQIANLVEDNDIADNVGHGTHVSGIIAARQGNSAGGAGIAPNARVLVYKATIGSGGSLSTAGIRRALEAARAAGVSVINMSLGGPIYDLLTYNIIRECIESGIPVVAAATNTGAQTLQYPAQYEGVISVAATDATGRRAPYSTYGAATLSAPGSYIVSTRMGGGYESKNGTSMAAPVVSGVVALYYSAMGTKDLNGDGTANAGDVAFLTNALRAACTPVTGSASGMGAGIVNATNLFKNVVGRPEISLQNADGSPFDGKTSAVPTTASVFIKAGYNGDYLLYTTDGKSPSIKDGEVAYGTEAYKSVAIPLTNFAVGKATIKVMSVNAQGQKSGVCTFSFTVDNLTAHSVAISGSRFVGAGKSGAFSASLTPVSKTLKPVWSIVSDTSGNGKNTVGKSNGKLAVHKSTPIGSVITLRATVGTGSEAVTDDFDVTVVSPISSITLYSPSEPDGNLNNQKRSLYVGDDLRIVPKAMLSNKDILDGATQMDYAVTLSSAQRASCEPDGDTYVITALAPGSVTLTLKALDGSGKTARLSLAIRQAVTGVSISDGTSAILAHRKSRALKASVTPSNATLKTVGWALVGTIPAGVKLSSGGKLTIPNRDELIGQTVTVRCSAKDAPNVYAEQTVTITPPVTQLTLSTDDPRATHNSKNILTGGMLFTIPIAGSPYDANDPDFSENQMQLGFESTGIVPNELNVVWSSSSTKVATVDENGLVSAVSPGYATITCTAQDGTGRKASVRLRVARPVSAMHISPASRASSSSYFATLAYGKSLKFGTVYGGEYGVPTMRSVKWSFELRYYPKNSAYQYDIDNKSFFTVVDDPIQRGFIKLSNGTLTVSRALYTDYPPDTDADYIVKVTATAADGSGTAGSYFVMLSPPTTFIKAMTGAFTVCDEDGNELTEYSGDPITLTSDSVLYASGVTTGTCYFATDYYDAGISSEIFDLSLSTSNLKVASPYQIRRADASYYVKIGDNTYPLYSISVKADSIGSATIRATANDGTGKSAGIKVTVRRPVTGITLSGGGRVILAHGKSRTLKATVSPSTATLRTVNWSIAGTVPDGVKVSSGGKITIPNNAALVGETFNVRCTSNDRATVFAQQVITITAPVKSLILTANDVKLTQNSNGLLSGGVLYTEAIDGSIYDTENNPNTENQTTLGYDVEDGTLAAEYAQWSTSNAKVAIVDQMGRVTAVAPGYATITCTAQDGTGKSASVRLRVILPPKP